MYYTGHYLILNYLHVDTFLKCMLLFFYILADLSPKFKDFLPNVLDRHIKVSRHLPVCVIYRKPGRIVYLLFCVVNV